MHMHVRIQSMWWVSCHDSMQAVTVYWYDITGTHPPTNSTSCHVTQRNTSISVSCDHTPSSSPSHTPSPGLLVLLQERTHMADLSTAMLQGEDTQLSFKPLPSGTYLLTVLPPLQNTPNIPRTFFDAGDTRNIIHRQELLVPPHQITEVTEGTCDYIADTKPHKPHLHEDSDLILIQIVAHLNRSGAKSRTRSWSQTT